MSATRDDRVIANRDRFNELNDMKDDLARRALTRSDVAAAVSVVVEASEARIVDIFKNTPQMRLSITEAIEAAGSFGFGSRMSPLGLAAIVHGREAVVEAVTARLISEASFTLITDDEAATKRADVEAAIVANLEENDALRVELGEGYVRAFQ